MNESDTGYCSWTATDFPRKYHPSTPVVGGTVAGSVAPRCSMSELQTAS